MNLGENKKDVYAIYIATGSIFFPYYLTAIIIIGVLFYFLMRKNIFQLMKQTPASFYIVGAIILGSVTSLIYHNYIGFLASVMIFIIVLYSFYLRAIMDSKLLEKLLTLCCVLSLSCVILAIYQYVNISHSLGYSVWQLHIENSPLHRVTANFLNSNYYAMIIEFVVMIACYKLINCKNKYQTIFYIICIACNIFALYLTGCRTAWFSFVLAVPALFWLNKNKKMFWFSMCFIGLCLLSLLFFPEILRSDPDSTLSVREDIWKTAFAIIKTHPLLGQGPLTYMHAYAGFLGPYTQHAHSIYIDPFLNFGLLGTILILIYVIRTCRDVIKLYTHKINQPLAGLIVAFCLCVGVHGILDTTLFWIQTALLFLLVFSVALPLSKNKMREEVSE